MNRATRFPFTLRAFAAWLALVLMLAASAPGFAKKVLQDGGGADPEVEERIDEAKDELPEGSSRPRPGDDPRLGLLQRPAHSRPVRRPRRTCGPRRAAVRCDRGKKPDCSTIASACRTAQRTGGAADLIEDFKGGSVGHLEDQLANIDEQICVRWKASLRHAGRDCGPNWLGRQVHGRRRDRCTTARRRIPDQRHRRLQRLVRGDLLDRRCVQERRARGSGRAARAAEVLQFVVLLLDQQGK